MMIKKLIVQLEKHIKEIFPEYNAQFCSNHRNFYIHMDLGSSLFSFDNYQILLEEIDNSLGEHLETKILLCSSTETNFLYKVEIQLHN